MVGEMSRRVKSIYEEVTLLIYFIFITFYFILEYRQLAQLLKNSSAYNEGDPGLILG